MEVVVPLLIYAVFGFVVALIASSRGRSPFAWFFLGCVLGCFGIILVLVLPDLKVQQEKERRLMNENRRLRERVKKDRLVADQRHLQIEQRLDVHDVALGVETGRASRQLGPPPPPISDGSESFDLETEWHVNTDDGPIGPVSLDELAIRWRRREVDARTYVWNENLPTWRRIGQLPSLKDILDA